MRSFAPTRISSTTSANISTALYDRIKAHADHHGLTLANTLRTSLLHDDFSAPPAGMPTDFINYHGTPTRSVSLSIKSDSLRREYESYAKHHNLTMTQLMAQAAYDYTGKPSKKQSEE